jgi:pimeloyl-ACP methyl ester carboxylesterase
LNAIEQLVEKLELKMFDILGHSMGAIFASLFAIKHPEKIRNVFLLSPAGLSKDMITEDKIENFISARGFLWR